MQDVFLTSYSVKGIKNLDQLITLDFYKKTITKSLDTQEYNLKGIYGMNGSGKSAIVTSVKILKNLLSDSNYLNNPIMQQNLDSLINKEEKSLYLSADFILNIQKPVYFRYSVTLVKNDVDVFIIDSEKLCVRKSINSSVMNTIYEVKKGKIIDICPFEEESNIFDQLKEKTVNLLESSTLTVLSFEKMVVPLLRKGNQNYSPLLTYLSIPFIFRVHTVSFVYAPY